MPDKDKSTQENNQDSIPKIITTTKVIHHQHLNNNETSSKLTLVPLDRKNDINDNVSPDTSEIRIPPKMKNSPNVRKSNYDSITTIAIDHIRSEDNQSYRFQALHHSLPNQTRPRSRSKKVRKNVGRFLLWAASKVLF